MFYDICVYYFTIPHCLYRTVKSGSVSPSSLLFSIMLVMLEFLLICVNIRVIMLISTNRFVLSLHFIRVMSGLLEHMKWCSYGLNLMSLEASCVWLGLGTARWASR